MNSENQQRLRAMIEERRQSTVATIERALNDSAFREQFIDRAQPAASGPDGAATAVELPEEVVKERHDLLKSVLDRAQSDGAFRQRLLSEPHKALEEAGFGPQIERIRAQLPPEEVRGYGTATWGTPSGGLTTTFLYTGFTSGIS
ncbi:MAG TPA: hypothetical protein VKX16_12075 [Chloroflexota bacterium]|nr:hypothetical protein [Chloroflexota bacterium]